MQYAVWEVKENIKIIIDANEIKELNDLEEKGLHDFKEFEPKEEDLTMKLVYGALIPQYEYDKNGLKEKISLSIGKALGYIKNGTCTLLELLDIKLLGPEINGRIPFAAIINTNLNIDNKKKQSLSTFLKYSNLSITNNIFNRFGIFAIKEQENRIKESLSKDTWKNFIDEDRAIRVAKKII